MPEIQDGNVVETILTPLADYIATKQREINNIQSQILLLQSKQQQVLADLQALLNQGE